MGFAPESSWHWGFGAAAVGMFLGLVQYLWAGGSTCRAAGTVPGRAGVDPRPPPAAADRQVRPVGLVTRRSCVGRAAAGACAGGRGTRSGKRSRATSSGADRSSRWGSSLWLFLAGKWTPEERKRLVVIAGPVRGRRRLLDGLRAGRLDPQPLRRAQHPTTRPSGSQLPAELVPVAAAVLHHPVRSPVFAGSGCVWAAATRPARPSSPSRWCSLALGFALMIGAAAVGGAAACG